MKPITRSVVYSLLMLAGVSAQAANPVRFVNPRIGSEAGGNVFVGPVMPFGMIKPGPDAVTNPNAGWSPLPSPIKGFSLTHVSGTGGGAKYGNISLMPVSGPCDAPADYADLRKEETIELGYYAAQMEKSGAGLEITASHKSAFFRLSYDGKEKPGLLVDAGHFLCSYPEHDRTEGQDLVGSQIEVVSDTEVRGYNRVRGGWNRGGPYTVYFWLVSDVPFEHVTTWKGNTVSDRRFQPDSNEPVGAILRFPASCKRANVKIGISFLSELKARENLQEEISGWDFESVRSQLEDTWNSLLSRVEIASSATEAQKEMFYTALYHTMLMPVDRTGDNPLWKSEAPYYDDFYAIWDTFRTSMPLITLMDPQRQTDIVNSLLDIYDHDGYMPDARSGNSNGRTQGASNGEIVIADAYVKGLGGIDYAHALEAMLKDATVPPGGDEEAEGRGGLTEYNTLGYIPFGIARAGSRTVDYSYCDYAIAKVAEGMGRNDIAAKYYQQAGNWKNLWRSDYMHKGTQGFIMPRDASGRWLDDLPYWGDGSKTFSFTPVASEFDYAYPWWQTFFYEGSGWEYSLAIPHDIPALIQLSGGEEAFLRRLETFFDEGLYNIGNEPSFLSPCLYHWIGRPDRSSDRVREFVERYFKNTSRGIPGNDDSGAMSSWLAFHMAGIYPVAGQDLYLIHSPLVESTTFHLDGGKDFTIVARHFSKENRYIVKAELDGKPYPYAAIRHADLARGGKLVLVMGRAPARWGMELVPPAISPRGNGLTRFVDPFIGTMGQGNVFAGACLPHGFVKLGADTGPGSSASGFKKNKDVEGFSHLHISGMGGPLYGNIQLLPTTGKLDYLHHSSPKGEESGAPGYYSVELKKYGTTAELSATAHAGIHRYTFPKSEDAHILVDLGATLYGIAQNWGSSMPIGSEVHVDPDRRVVYGHGSYKGGRSTIKPWTVYFYAEFDTPFASHGFWEEGNEKGVHLDFSTKEGQQILVKVGISMIDENQAKANLEKEIPDWSFERVYRQADAAWEKELRKIEVSGLSEKDSRIFYTALYHALFCPSDWTGENKVFDYGRPYYEDFLCTWDIQRTVMPLLALISTGEYTDMLNTMLDVYRHDGWLADAHSSLQREFTQVGSNTDVLFADAYVKKIPGIDYRLAYEAVRKNALDASNEPQKIAYGGRPSLSQYMKYGYLPADLVGRITVSRSLEYVYEDFCVYQMAREFGTREDVALLKERSLWYKNLWDPSIKLVRGKNSDGSWITPFDPYKNETGVNFYEGHAYTWTYSVPHDVKGLIDLFGGKKAFVDSLSNAVGNRYQAYNEPCMLQIYLFAWAGRPDLIQKYLHKAIAENFSDKFNGLPGNDDSGTTSAWYVWSRMGIFPVAGQNLYIIGSPSYPESVLHMENGKDIVITARNASPENIYIQSAKLNGKRYNKSFFTQEDIRDGAHFEFVMGPKPSKWGSKATPASLSDK